MSALITLLNTNKCSLIIKLIIPKVAISSSLGPTNKPVNRFQLQSHETKNRAIRFIPLPSF